MNKETENQTIEDRLEKKYVDIELAKLEKNLRINRNWIKKGINSLKIVMDKTQKRIDDYLERNKTPHEKVRYEMVIPLVDEPETEPNMYISESDIKIDRSRIRRGLRALKTVMNKTQRRISYHLKKDKTLFDKDDIRILKSKGMTLEEAKKYDKRFGVFDVIGFRNIKCTPEIANTYQKRFNGHDIIDLFQNKCFPEEANKFDKRFHSLDIEGLKSVNCTPEIANTYQKRFDGYDVFSLYKLGCSPEHANSYPKKFEGGDVFYLFKRGFKPEDAQKYYKGFAGFEISIMWSMEIKPEMLSLEKQRRLRKLIKKVISGRMNIGIKSGEGIAYKPERIKFLGSGYNSIVLMGGNRAFKFSKDVYRDYLTLEHVQKANKYNLKNVINVIREDAYSYYLPNFVIEVEYVQGDSLENKIKKEGELSKDKAIQYGADILNGVRELRVAKIYHRDIHGGNIMIDEKKDRAVIIDLGASTPNPKEIHALNRAYGGNNDLISLGLLIYKMAKGDNLFKEGPGFTCYSAVKEGIKTKREETYDDPEKKKAMLEKVREGTPGELGEITANLLDDDLWVQPEIEKVEATQKMFEEYAK